MKKVWGGAFLLLCSISAHAQSVTLYGIVDTGIEYLTHADAAGDKLITMPGTTGMLPSRWGLRGEEPLGGGMKAIFRLESGFNLRDGTLGQGGREFGRQSYVGLSSEYGTVTLGRQNSMTYWAFFDTDVFGPAIYSIGSLDAYLAGARVDNSIAYRGEFGGFTLGATYSFGRDAVATPATGGCAGNVPGEYSQCKQWSAMLKYDSTLFGVASSYEQMRGGTSSTVSFYDGFPTVPVVSGGATDSRYQVNGYFYVKGIKITAGWLGRDVNADKPGVSDVRSNIFFTGFSVPIRPDIVFDAAVYRIVVKEQDARATLGVVRGTYLLSKRTSLYSTVGYLGNSAKAHFSVSSAAGATNPAAGVGQLGAMVGMTHRF